jgi:hypothetical protein
MSASPTITPPPARRAGALDGARGARREPPIGARPVARAERRAPRGGEVAVCAALLALLALVMSASHVRHGGLYYDDWTVLALGRFPPPGGLLHGLSLYYGQRPGQVLYYAAFDQLLGAHVAPRLALAAAMVALQATLVYVLLRRLGLLARDALACAALSLAFPFSDSVWLWGILSLASLAIAASLLGVILALRAFERRGTRALALHATSLALYLIGILSYEIFAVAGALAGLLYVRAVGLARARARWALDVGAIAAAVVLTRALLPIDYATPSRAQALTGTLHHAVLMAQGGARVAGAAILPIGGVSAWVGFALLLAVIALAGALRLRLPPGDGTRRELGRWLQIAGAGLALAAAGWAVYLPAPDHYLPSSAGTVTRVNALAAIGIAVLVYASLMLLGRTAGRIARAPASAGAAAATALAVALCIAYLHRSAADAGAWNAAASDQRAVLADLRAGLPRAPRAAVIFAFDAPLRVGPGVPVLNTRLDLTSAVRISYGSPSLTALPLARATEVSCGRRGPLADGVGGRYGNSYLLDVRARHASLLADPAQCGLQIAHASGAASALARGGTG